MTIDELKALLKTTGLPVAFNVFQTPQSPPRIQIDIPDSDNLFADNKTYVKIKNADVMLITNFKDEANEKLIEDLFDSNSIPYNSSDLYYSDTKLYEVTYSISI